MKKFLLSCALFLGVSGAANAFTVQDICKTYSYEGEVYLDYLVFDKTKTVSGWNVADLTGTVTIEAVEGNQVLVKGLFPGANDLTAVFDEEANTLTFDVQIGKVWTTGGYDYSLYFGTGEVTTDADGYYVVDPVNEVVGTFDEKGALSIEEWMLIDDYYFEPYAEGGYTVCTPATETKVANIEVENAPAVYYNLQGQRVENPAKGIYVVRQGAQVKKVVL